MNEQLRAWKVGTDGEYGIVLATSPAKAKTFALQSARDAGYNYRFTDFRCHRSRKHDPLHHIVGPGQYLSCEIADQMLTVSGGEAAKLARA